MSNSRLTHGIFFKLQRIYESHVQNPNFIHKPSTKMDSYVTTQRPQFLAQPIKTNKKPTLLLCSPVFFWKIDLGNSLFDNNYIHAVRTMTERMGRQDGVKVSSLVLGLVSGPSLSSITCAIRSEPAWFVAVTGIWLTDKGLLFYDWALTGVTQFHHCQQHFMFTYTWLPTFPF